MSSLSPMPVESLRRAMVIRSVGATRLAAEAGISARTMSRALAGYPVTLDVRGRISAALARLPKDAAIAAAESELAS